MKGEPGSKSRNKDSEHIKVFFIATLFRVVVMATRSLLFCFFKTRKGRAISEEYKNEYVIFD